jgi:hypothetical protein
MNWMSPTRSPSRSLEMEPMVLRYYTPFSLSFIFFKCFSSMPTTPSTTPTDESLPSLVCSFPLHIWHFSNPAVDKRRKGLIILSRSQQRQCGSVGIRSDPPVPPKAVRQKTNKFGAKTPQDQADVLAWLFYQVSGHGYPFYLFLSLSLSSSSTLSPLSPTIHLYPQSLRPGLSPLFPPLSLPLSYALLQTLTRTSQLVQSLPRWEDPLSHREIHQRDKENLQNLGCSPERPRVFRDWPPDHCWCCLLPMGMISLPPLPSLFSLRSFPK